MMIMTIIIKITISLTVIGLKNSFFPLIHLPSCYQLVTGQFVIGQFVIAKIGQFNRPVTFKVVF